MLWHVNEAMEGALGRIQVDAEEGAAAASAVEVHRAELSVAEGAPTLKRWVPQARQLRFRGRARRVSAPDRRARVEVRSTMRGPTARRSGRMSGKEVSRLHAKHLNHHLTQFGV